MKNSMLIFIALFSSLYSMNVKKSDLFLEFLDFDSYKIFSEKSLKASATVNFSHDIEGGDFIAVMNSGDGVFESGFENISYEIDGGGEKNMERRFPLVFSQEEGEYFLPINFTLPGGVVLSPGTYVAHIPIKILKGEEIVSQEVVYASFAVDQQLDVQIILDGKIRNKDDINVDFGEINEFSQKSFDLIVKSNSCVSVSISSKNKGQMVLEEEKEDSPFIIPYLIENQGKLISLLTEALLFSEPFDSRNHEIHTNIRLRLKPDDRKTFCGKYSDQIRITVSSL
jgi:hypothetical protein